MLSIISFYFACDSTFHLFSFIYILICTYDCVCRDMFIDRRNGKKAEDIPCIVDHLLDKPPSQGHENIKKAKTKGNYERTENSFIFLQTNINKTFLHKCFIYSFHVPLIINICYKLYARTFSRFP